MASQPTQRMVRVNADTHQTLRDLSARSGDSIPTILGRAVERYRRQQLLLEANEQWAAIMSDPDARREIEAEDRLWEATLADGLEREEW